MTNRFFHRAVGWLLLLATALVSGAIVTTFFKGGVIFVPGMVERGFLWRLFGLGTSIAWFIVFMQHGTHLVQLGERKDGKAVWGLILWACVITAYFGGNVPQESFTKLSWPLFGLMFAWYIVPALQFFELCTFFDERGERTPLPQP